MAAAALVLKMCSKNPAHRDGRSPSQRNCLFWRSRHEGNASRDDQTVPLVREEKDQVEVILTTGSVDTFARQWIEPQDRRQPQSEKKNATKDCPQLVIAPYFGNFAGHKMTFNVKRNSHNISVRIEGTNEKAHFYHQHDTKLNGVRDQCLRFVHDFNASSNSDPIPGFKRKPLSLAFLCEQTALVHLDKIDVNQMPTKYQELFKGTSQQDIVINIWPRSLYKTPIIMRVKTNIALREFEWMLCHRLSLPNPSHITLYHSDDFIRPLRATKDEEQILLPEHKELHCILSPSIYHDLRANTNERVLVVSVMEHGITDIKVHSSMQLQHFERIIRDRFKLDADSFLYIPEVISTQPSIKMSVLLNDENLDFLSNSSRNLPLIREFGSLPVKRMYRNLPLYTKTLEELGLFDNSLITVFEVTGPTVPIEFRRFGDVASGTSTPVGSRSSGENFVFITEKASAVSINPDWSVQTLLHYVDCMTAFPYIDIRLGSKILDGKIGKHLIQKWTKRERGQLCLKSKLPHMTCGLH